MAHREPQEEIIIKEAPIDEAVAVSAKVIEFDATYDAKYFEERYSDHQKVIIVAYVGAAPAGYIVGYDKDYDGSFYCWMAGVAPVFRKRGILKLMMDYLVRWAKSRRYRSIKIKTRNNRREMLSYLVKYGFLFKAVEPRERIEDNRILLEKYIGRNTFV